MRLVAGCKSNLGCDRKKKKRASKKKKQTTDGPIRKKDALVPFLFCAGLASARSGFVASAGGGAAFWRCNVET